MNSPEVPKLQQLTEAMHHALPELTLPIQAIYLYGSWGTEFERADSDLDLAVLAEVPLGMEQRLLLEQALRRCMHLPGEMDVIDLRKADTVFAAHLVTEARRLVVTDHDATMHFEALALAKYARLNEERAGVLADIRERGTVYKPGMWA